MKSELNEINAVIEGTIIDIVSEGMGTTFGLIMMWEMLTGGSFSIINEIMNVLVSAI